MPSSWFLPYLHILQLHIWLHSSLYYSQFGGDLGQTYNSNATLTHYEQNPAKGQTILYVGDLSYADDYPFHDNNKWDTWGRFTERIGAYQPWIWTAGNHEIDFAPQLVCVIMGFLSSFEFIYFLGRVLFVILLYTLSLSLFLWFFLLAIHASRVSLQSFKTTEFYCRVKLDHSSLILLVIMCHTKHQIVHLLCGKYTPQYKWLLKELPKVNRTETPWLIVLMHCPIYNSYVNHYMEGETVRVLYEKWFLEYKVDVVFAGHVHAYERSERVSNVAYKVNGLHNPINDQSAPVYITIGNGGNVEGLATAMTEPQPSYSACREASFGHGILDIKNRTHAHFSWNRNQDEYAVMADSIWLHNSYCSHPEQTSILHFDRITA